MEQVELTRTDASAYIDRGDSGVGYTVWNRDLRTSVSGNSRQTSILSEQAQDEELRRLYSLLVQPIEGYLTSINSTNDIAIIPQGVLFNVPFSALKDESGSFLLDKYNIHIVPSAQVLRYSFNTIKDFPSKNEVLLIGNPLMPSLLAKEKGSIELKPMNLASISDKPVKDMSSAFLQEFPLISSWLNLIEPDSSEKLPSLPGAEKEVENLAGLLESDFFVRRNATEDLVKHRMPDARLVHLATLVVQKTHGSLRMRT